MRTPCFLSGVLVAVTLGSSGCGVILNGSSQTVTAQSSPDGAQITVEPGGMRYTAPTEMSLERKSSYVLTFRKEGYSDATFAVRKKANVGIIILDVLLTGLIGVVVDAATGAWNGLSPDAATVALTRIDASLDGPEEILVGLRSSRRGIVIDAPTSISVGISRQE